MTAAERAIEDLVRMNLSLFGIYTVLRAESEALELGRFPWCGELHWRLTLRLHELADEYERLVQAREILLGERKRAQLLELEPPRRPVAPSQQIAQASAGIASALRTVMGE